MPLQNTLFGAAYYDEYMPYDRIDTDFALMKDAGMNVIRIAESTWSTWEPEDNVFDFSHLHRMLSAAIKYDLQVIIGTPTYAIPAWLVKKHPDILAITVSGQGIYGHRQIHDITNPHFLYYAERIIRKLLAQVADHPVVIGYQIDNETRSGEGMSPENQRRFIRHLQQKYPDIETFNRKFGLDYWSNRIQDWDDMPDLRGTINGSLSAAYKSWLRDQITAYQQWQADIIREYSRPDQFITHNYDFSWKGYSHGMQPLVDQHAAAAAVDIAGVDIYHLSQDRFDGSTISFGGAIGHSLKQGNYLVLETQAQGRLDWLPYPGQLRQAYYSHLASGANGVMYWNWHSIHNSLESYWKGILSHDLLPGATYYELAATRSEALSFDAHLLDLEKQCPVAILADHRSLTGLDEFPIDDVSEKISLQEESEVLDYNHILRWMYDACYQMNLEADIIYKEDILDGNTSHLVQIYPLLLVPALYSAPEELITKIRAYVQAGGHLLAGFKSFFSNEDLKIYADAQPHHMTDLFGGTFDQFTRPVNTEVSIDDRSYQTTHWIELLRPIDAEVWGSYKHPHWGTYSAILHRKDSGMSGSATYLGCYLERAGLTEILKKLVALAGIDLPRSTFPVIIKKGLNRLGETVIYYFNYSDVPRSAVYEYADGWELISRTPIRHNEMFTLNPWDVKIFTSG